MGSQIFSDATTCEICVAIIKNEKALFTYYRHHQCFIIIRPKSSLNLFTLIFTNKNGTPPTAANEGNVRSKVQYRVFFVNIIENKFKQVSMMLKYIMVSVVCIQYVFVLNYY